MTVQVIFFASLREDLGCEGLSVDVPAGSRVSEVINQLAGTKDESWHTALTAENIRVAVNQSLVNGDEMLGDGDEVAFFPPVTGG